VTARPAASGQSSLRPTRENRVRKRAEFLAVQSRGARVTGDCLVFILSRRVVREPEAEIRDLVHERPAATRLGITASRKIGGAVQRNRAKRLIREGFRAVFNELPAAIDIVVIVRRPLGERKLVDILGEWQRALPQIRRKASA
jgi:ribonuclease P protein component